MLESKKDDQLKMEIMWLNIKLSNTVSNTLYFLPNNFLKMINGCPNWTAPFLLASVLQLTHVDSLIRIKFKSPCHPLFLGY